MTLSPTPQSSIENKFDPDELEQLLTRLSELMDLPVAQLRVMLARVSLLQRPPRREAYAHLRGQGITISRAAKKYKTPGTTLRGWMSRGYIAILKPAHPRQLDEGDVAFCVAVKAHRDQLGIGAKVAFFDEAGEPVYAPKYEANYEANLSRRLKRATRVARATSTLSPAKTSRRKTHKR